jgi:hypothetical protein
MTGKVKVEAIHELPLQKLEVKCCPSAAGKETPTFVEFLIRRIESKI